MAGGAGNDTYYVDNTGDIITEAASAGTDTVIASATYTLAANVENLTLITAAAINGTGNTLSNVLTGNSAANTLNGGTGADTMVGGAGNDTYVVDNIGDVVTENLNEGIDLVQAGVTYSLAAHIENLTLTGSNAINATGNLMDNVLMGNSAINTLTGGAGQDVLTGGGGKDVFDFNLIAESGVGGAAYDVITDFLAGTDRIDLLNIDANAATTGDQAFSFIGTGAFTGAGQLRFVFDGTNTLVQGNIDAALGVDFEILLLGNQTLVAANFVL
jgi:Ca2+-binding RTX toxin-like protein